MIRVWWSIILIFILVLPGPLISCASEETIPVAVISIHPSDLEVGESALFSADESFDPDGQIVSYYWDFGDGSADTGSKVRHVYSHQGIYITTLKVTDDRGLHSIDMVETIVVSNGKATISPTNSPPMAHIKVHPNPATEGEKVTFECIGEDQGGEVVVCVSIFPDGRVRTVRGGRDYFEEDKPLPGLYIFKVKDNEGEWSEEVSLELEVTPAITTITWLWVSIALLFAAIPTSLYAVNRNRSGSIHVDSNPYGAKVFLDKSPEGESPVTINKIPIGDHVVELVKFGYYIGKEDVTIIANQMSTVHTDLVDIPNIRLKITSDPPEIQADGRSRSIITISIEGEQEGKKVTPIIVSDAIEVNLKTDLGSIESPVRIHRGSSFATSVLISTATGGTANVTARIDTEERFKLGGNVKVVFPIDQ